MTDPTDAPDGSVEVSAEELEELAATVHTYESFGRAIVVDALTEMARSGSDAPLSASVSVRPVRRDRPGDTAGGFAKGHYEDPHCHTIYYSLGKSGPIHHITVCPPW